MIPETVNAIIALILKFDWTYEMSDDHRMYQRGSAGQAEIIKAIMDLNRADLAVLAAWWKENKGEDEYGFKRWVGDRLEHCDNLFALADPEHANAR